MNHKKYGSIAQKAFVVMSSLVLAMGLGLASSSAALANEDHHGDHRDHHEEGDRHHEEDRREFVSIGGNTYFVDHDGNGPFIRVNGNKYYLDGNTVVVNGKRYDVQREDRHEGDRHERDHHEGDRHHRDHHKD